MGVVELLELQTIEKYGEHVLISKNPDFGSEEYCKDQAAEKERLDKSKKCEISRQIVSIEKKNAKFSTIQIKVLNPLDNVTLVFKKGDIVCLYRCEKPADPLNKAFKTYTMMKNQKELEKAISQDGTSRDKEKDKKAKKKKRSKKKK